MKERDCLINYDIIIIGAGAAGLMCAAKLSNLNLNKKILIIEKMNKIGRKVLATGNGKCNLSNQDMNKSHYHSSNKEFINSIPLNNEILDYFNKLGLKVKLIDNGYYPITEQALSVVDTLRLAIEGCNNIEILLETEVKSIAKGINYEVKTADKLFTAEVVVISMGGCASPIYGSNGSGYELLTNLKHLVTPVYKALVQLRSNKITLKYLKGLRMQAIAKIYVNNELKKEETGEVQFTDYGLSGICIFNLSYIASYHKEMQNDDVKIKLDLMPDMSYEELKRELLNRKEKFKERLIDYYLTGLINNKLSYAIYQEFKIDYEKKVSTIKETDIEVICRNIKEYEFNIMGTNGFDNAQVTAGGIDTKEIYPHTFESKIHRDLYIIGEILDINGDCGGYNLNFAFTTGYIAAQSIGDRYDKNN